MSKTKYHPILFSTPMVQAILEERKTQTRRTKGLESLNENPDAWKHVGIAIIGNIPVQKNKFRIYQCFEEKGTGKQELVKCPYELEDVLWVRETFTEWPENEFQYFVDTALGEELGKWKPSIHMPKKACRIFLKIKSIRVERLQDISEEDAVAEGIKPTWISNEFKKCRFRNYINNGEGSLLPIDSFKSLWQSINGKESLEQNPFVWVYEFEHIEKPLDFIV